MSLSEQLWTSTRIKYSFNLEHRDAPGAGLVPSEVWWTRPQSVFGILRMSIQEERRSLFKKGSMKMVWCSN